jgi:hypothetical protein
MGRRADSVDWQNQCWPAKPTLAGKTALVAGLGSCADLAGSVGLILTDAASFGFSPSYVEDAGIGTLGKPSRNGL